METRVFTRLSTASPVMSQIKSSLPTNNTPKPNQTIEAALVEFMRQHHTHLPSNLHNLATQAIEKPLLRLVMRKTDNNQSKAAKILGLNRATLHKKLVEYQLLEEFI